MFLPSLEEIHIIELVELHRELHRGLDLRHARFRAGGWPVSNDLQQNCADTEQINKFISYVIPSGRKKLEHISTLKFNQKNTLKHIEMCKKC